ncbi:peptidase M23 [Vibrio sp. T187]|uniref:peptidoglycan DD-metalloendopeptidase family protein n=1 Tax=Vibrio TaxID=662 RepID=UPI0010C9A563|nr:MULTISPECIES: peptidoglycan DD-metalloendopeptidase family protein [Vibrio]MBW3696904.1 peptidase M23 [Vibrio sp. T187]
MKSFRPIVFVIAVLAFTLAILIPTEQASDLSANKIELEHPPKSHIVLKPLPSEPLPQPEPLVTRVDYIVKVGDTLSGIFSSLGLSYKALNEILGADQIPLQLDTLKPGDHLELMVDRDRELLSLTFHISLVEKAIYTKESDEKFHYEFKEEQGEWREELYSGTINGSFSMSAHQLGLSSKQIAQITRILRDKLDFSRSLRAGDRFDVLVNHQFLGEHATGNSEIQGISFKLVTGEVAAFLASDGRFYDRDGNSLERAFNRYPVDEKYRRITSPFNPKRKHPVTGRVTPHNGTDFATPVGAAVYSTGDGKVIGVRNHPYAGKYLVIEHNSVYKTRYLHLDRFLVKKGDYVKRGQKIAISGATGRLTGPHLHFEVLVRNRAVDAMKADLPLATSIPEEDKASFLTRIIEFDSMISGQTNV